MPSQRRAILGVLAALILAATTFSVGFSVAENRNGDEPRSLLSTGAIPEGQGGRVLEEALEQIMATSVEPPSERALVRGAIRGMIRVLKRRGGDPYALFYSPAGYESFQELTTGKFSGIGVWLRYRDDDLEIVSVLPGTPAEASGLQPGDVIRSIDGKGVDDDESDLAVERIKGKPGSEVTLVVERDGEEIEYTITRRQIELPNLRSSTVGDDVGVIRLFGFARGAGDQVREEVEALTAAGAQGIILDLRDNGGGLFSEAIEVASVFIEDGEVVVYREKGQDDIVYEATGDAYQSLPLVVLANEGTASAAEIVVGALQERERAIFVGATTYGKGSVQEVIPLIDSSAVKLTTAHYLTPSREPIDGKGIEPDVVVAESPRAQRSRAVEILRGIVVSMSGSTG